MDGHAHVHAVMSIAMDSHSHAHHGARVRVCVARYLLVVFYDAPRGEFTVCIYILTVPGTCMYR